MEAEGLHMAIDYVGSSGVILSTEQKAALQSSLVILQSNYKFRGVKFWGKIFGVKSDYFIVQGVGKDELKDRKTLYRYMIVEKAGKLFSLNLWKTSKQNIIFL